ncbi:MAG: cob(I)yrinic acid a,c-diamide adenosyltransferase [Candidatus Omnitrophica bacterium]|nr:cob(I)yrinic acid a,c-diamide adenosyltransferase [Candidatus Omnitrophota bacterium]
MVHFYIGDGKGKTTASLGLAIRAHGCGKRVYVAQFLKDSSFVCGEANALKSLGVKIDRFDGQKHPMFSKNIKEDHEKTERSIDESLDKIDKIIAGGDFDLIILDEILNALAVGFISVKRLGSFIDNSNGIELIFTGCDAPAELIKKADYVSFVTKIKHPFDLNVAARKGVEF